MAPTPSPRARRRSAIPDDVLRHHVLPRLPFKQIARLRTLSKAYRSLLTDDPNFAAGQARLCPPSFTLIRTSMDELQVLSSTPDTGGIPSPSLDFLGYDVERAVIHASTNGLLVVCCSHYRSVGPPPTFFITNPATRLAQQIPDATMAVTLGLAFDPSVDAHKFSIVQPVESVIVDTTEFSFRVFSSDTGRWTAPGTRVTTNWVNYWCGKKSYAAGVLYFDYMAFILCFDVATSAAAAVNMPWSSSSSQDARMYCRWCTEACGEGQRLQCTATENDALTVYHLVEDGGGHSPLGGEAPQGMGGDDGGERRCVQVLPLHEAEVGAAEGRYDMVTGETTVIGDLLGRFCGMTYTFRYLNSMAAIPPIATLAPASQDGNLRW